MNDPVECPAPAPTNPVVETWRATVWGIGHHAFLIDVHADRTWQILRIGLQRLGDYELVERTRGGPSHDFEADIRAALAQYSGTITLRRDSNSCGGSGFSRHRFGVKPIIQTGV